MSVLFRDLVGSTDRQTRIGDEAADEFRRRFFATLAEAVAVAHGEMIKNTGDGLMVVFRDTALARAGGCVRQIKPIDFAT